MGARDGSSIVHRERVEVNVKKLRRHIGTQRKAIEGLESLKKFIKRDYYV